MKIHLRKTYFCYFTLLILFGIFCIKFLINQNIFAIKDSVVHLKDDDKFKLFLNYSPFCEPLIKRDQYYVNIDNTIYPQYVPKMLNKSINFECMNQNIKRNRILLWNTFVGRNDFFFGKTFKKF